MGMYQKCYFCVGIDININLITCEDKIVILSILQSYVLHWYYTYLLHTVMNITEVTIHQNLYCPGMRKYVCKEVKHCDTFQDTKQSNIKHGKLTAKEAEEIPRNKLCMDIIFPYAIRRKVHKEKLNIKPLPQ